MSLIRDALERAREEAERQRSGGAPPVRSYRRPTPTPRGPWATAAVSGLIGAALAGGGLYLGWARQARPAETPTPATPQAPIAAIAPAATSPLASPPARASSAPAAGPAAPQPTTPAPTASAARPMRPAAPSPTTVATTVATPGPPGPPPSAQAPRAPAVERVDAAPKASPQAPSVYADEATTPGGATMGLGGIAFSPSGPVALVNGKALGIGEGLVSSAGEAFVVEAIERDRVTLVSAGVRLVIVLH